MCDLAWLEPRVQDTLKKFVRREGRIKRLREDVNALENQLIRRRLSLAATEVNLQEARLDLEKVKQGFNGIDMDSVVGYGMP